MSGIGQCPINGISWKNPVNIPKSEANGYPMIANPTPANTPIMMLVRKCPTNMLFRTFSTSLKSVSK